jgi:D-amino peptidase
MRVHISVDMEGIAGVVDGQDVRPGESEYERNRHLMTAEANAAIRGVLEADRSAQVVVSDAHAQFRNLLPEDLVDDARLIRGRPRPFGMLGGLDASFDLAIFVGYHGRAGTQTSVLAHTISGAAINEVRVDGEPLGEIGLNASLAAYHGCVPVLVTGDDTVAEEAGKVVPGIHSVVVKRALAAGAAESLHPKQACARISIAVLAAIADAPKINPRRYEGAVELEVDVTSPYVADQAMLAPGMARLGGRTVGYRAPDFPTAYQVVMLVAALGQR